MDYVALNPGSPTRTDFVRGGVEKGARKRFQFQQALSFSGTAVVVLCFRIMGFALA